MMNFNFLRDKLERVETEQRQRKEIAELEAEVARLNEQARKDSGKIVNLMRQNESLRQRNDFGAQHNNVMVNEVVRLNKELSRERYIYGRALADVSRGEAIITAVFRHSGDYDRTNS